MDIFASKDRKVNPNIGTKKFLCYMKHGHMGAGKSREGGRLVWSDSLAEAMVKATHLPGVKKGKHPYNHIKSIVEV